MADVRFIWFDHEFDDLLNSPTGEVGGLLLELSTKAATVAKSVVHVLPGTPRSGYWTAKSTAVRPPGYTKRGTRVYPPRRWHGTGGLYAGVNAPAAPAIFLEYDQPHTEQYYDRYPFLTVGLDSLSL